MQSWPSLRSLRGGGAAAGGGGSQGGWSDGVSWVRFGLKTKGLGPFWHTWYDL